MATIGPDGNCTKYCPFLKAFLFSAVGRCTVFHPFKQSTVGRRIVVYGKVEHLLVATIYFGSFADPGLLHLDPGFADSGSGFSTMFFDKIGKSFIVLVLVPRSGSVLYPFKPNVKLVNFTFSRKFQNSSAV